MMGTIKRIVRDKGFGITPHDGSEEVFLHRSRLAQQATRFEDLGEGDEVEFHVRPGEKGPQAFDVQLR